MTDRFDDDRLWYGTEPPRLDERAYLAEMQPGADEYAVGPLHPAVADRSEDEAAA